MAKKKSKPLPIESPEDFTNHLVSVGLKESERGRYIVYAEMLSALLAEILLKVLRHSPPSDEIDSDSLLGSGPTNPLGSFSSRAKMCHRLGYISENGFKVLEGIRKIRNLAAHQFWHVDQEHVAAQIEAKKKEVIKKVCLCMGNGWKSLIHGDEYDRAVKAFMFRIYILTFRVKKVEQHPHAP